MKRTSALPLHLAVIAFYGLVALIVTYPLILNLSTQFAGFIYGDAHEMAHHVWWFGYALRTGQPIFTQTLLAYPHGIDGVTMWADPLQFFPAWALALILPLPAAINLQILFSMALNGWAMWWLARYLIGSAALTPHPPLRQQRGGEKRSRASALLRDGNDPTAEQGSSPLSVNGEGTGVRANSLLPPLLAGLVFMLFPTMQGHLGAGHAGLLVQWGVPLYTYFLFRLTESDSRGRGRIRDILLGALCFVIGAAGHSLQVIYVLMPLTGLFALALIVRRQWRALFGVIAAAGIGALALGVFLIPAITSTLGTSAYTDEGGMIRYSADGLAAVTPSFLHPVFGQFTYTHRVLGVNLDEGAAYIGIVAALLGVIALLRVKAARWWALVALAAYVLSLGALLKIFDQPVSIQFEGYSSGITLPFALIANLPIIRLARTPGRFNFLTALAVAALAGYGSAWLWARLRRISVPVRAAGMIALMGVIGFEYQTFFPLPTTPAAVPAAISDLQARTDIRAVLDLPWDNLVAAKDGLYLQTVHQHALIAGHVSRRTPVDPGELTLLEQTLDPALLDSVGADVIIVHRAQDDGGTFEARARAQLGDPIYEDADYAIFNRPAAADSPAYQFTAAPTSPDAATVYLYAPDSGWIDAGFAHLDTARTPELRVDGQRMFAWSDASADTDLQVWIPAAGFHTIRLASADPCPQTFDPSLICPPVGDLTLDRGFHAQAAPVPVTLQPGITLTGSRIDTVIGRAVHVYLTWQFDQPVTAHDVRYVHVIDAAGNPVLQDDHPLGDQAAGGGWQDQIFLYRSGFASGDYRVYVGWYHLADDGTLTPHLITSGAPDGSSDRDILIGTFTMP